MEPAQTQPTMIYWVVGCPECNAMPLQACYEDGKEMIGDIHLDRANLWVQARMADPKMTLSDLKQLVRSQNQPE